ncbi:MAG: PAS domain S-box protein [Acidobacteriota bacterium]
MIRDYELRLRTKSGDVRVFNVNVDTVEIGKERFTLTAAQDITERKQAEEERRNLEEQLRQAQKMEAVGRLAGGVAHDFNNMLGVILGNTELALADLPPESPISTGLTEVLSAAKRSADLTRQLPPSRGGSP